MRRCGAAPVVLMIPIPSGTSEAGDADEDAVGREEASAAFSTGTADEADPAPVDATAVGIADAVEAVDDDSLATGIAEEDEANEADVEALVITIGAVGGGRVATFFCQRTYPIVPP